MSNAATRVIEYKMRDITELLNIEGTEEVVVNEPNNAYVFRKGAWEHHKIDIEYDDLYDLAILSGSLRRQDVGPDMPLVGGDLPTGERFQFVVPPCVPNGKVSLTLRKPGESVIPMEQLTKKYVTDNWNQWESRKESANKRSQKLLSLYHSGNLQEFFLAVIAERLNVFMIGATGAGKTTVLKTFTANIPMHERLVTVEDACELIVPQPNHVRLLHSANYRSGEGIGPADLLKASLRMRPDRIFLQEIRDPTAAWVYVNSVNTGHRGSITTLHGGTPEEAFNRLFNLSKGSPEGNSFADNRLASLISYAVDVFIPFGKTEDYKFKINEVWFSAEAATRGQTAVELLHGETQTPTVRKKPN